jgi:hypothetical protein
MPKNFAERYAAAEVQLGREVLSEFVLEQAHRTAERVGFKWVGTTEAPDRYQPLVSAYQHSKASGEPLPISSENSHSVIYTSPDVNVAWRFWHDVHHVELGLSFKSVDELALALWHLGELQQAGFSRGSMPWRLLHADLVGQAHLWALARRYPEDQASFVRSCLSLGFEQGLLAEAKRPA